MTRYQAEKAAKQMLLSGYRHHSYEAEKRFLNQYFNGEWNTGKNKDQFSDVLWGMYADVLGPLRMRALKNSVICMVTIICRNAIEYGIDAELSFALSDYYINEVEKQAIEARLLKLTEDIMGHYYDLVQQEKTNLYSRPVAHSIRYINRCVYQPCSVANVSSYIGVTSNYLSELFREEVGITPSAYIRQKKMTEARNMLCNLGYSVAETADALGYYDAAHFSNVFKKYYGKNPSAMQK